MSIPQEQLWRATLHDLNNVLGSVQGILDLCEPHRPLTERERRRLETVLQDGMGLVGTARKLAVGPMPEPLPRPSEAWAADLRAALAPLADLFRTPIEVAAAGGAWPGDLLVEWAAAFTRQILPWVVPGPLRVQGMAADGTWTLRWEPAPPLPEAFRPGQGAKARNLPSLWVLEAGEVLGVAWEEGDGWLEARGRGPVKSQP